MVDLGKSTWKYCLEILTRAIGNRFGPDDHIYLVRTYGRSTVSKIYYIVENTKSNDQSNLVLVGKGGTVYPNAPIFYFNL